MFKFLKKKKKQEPPPKVSKEDLIKIKHHFRCFFEGDGLFVEPQVKVPVEKFQITDMRAEFQDKDTILLTVELGKVSMLIGRGALTVTPLCRYLSSAMRYKVKINAVQSKLWAEE